MLYIVTKVAENGWSIHDDNLSLIVAETCDMVELQQIIGRARVGRKKPREIQVPKSGLSAAFWNADSCI